MESVSAIPRPAVRPIEEVESVVIRFCGDSGDGMQLTGTEFTKAAALARNDLSTLPDFPAEIRAPAGTLAGVSGFQLNFSSREVFTPGDQPDVLVAMNPAALKTNLMDLRSGGILILNTGAFTAKNIEMAGYTSNPVEDGSLDKYQTHKIDISKLTQTALAETGLGTKEIARCKNYFALGLMFWMYNRPVEKEHESIREKFAKKPELAEANIKAFNAGFNYGETAEVFNSSFVVKAAAIEPGLYRNITGNSATAIGLVAAARLADLPLFLGGYPITPASDILHELSTYRHYGVTTFQAEDEIAGVGSAIGAAYGGALAVTSSSGPGIALKGEAIGLAVAQELPLVIVNVQRGGPSTGLPTKTEQADLLQALYGRNGECPVPVIAAMTPADCFYAAIEAARVAVKYMIPVFLLTDGYLANGAEPWLLPRFEDLPKFKVTFRTDPNNYQVYERDANMARAWVRPGTPGLEHRIGGLEKHELTGNISYDALNHHKMVKTRQARVDKVAPDTGDLLLDGPDEGDLLLVGWGSTYGSITQGTATMRRQGLRCSSVHLRWLSPLHPKLGELLKRFKHVLVPEMNNGQLIRVLRAEYLVDAKGLNKIEGKPFKVTEICAAIEGVLKRS
jgi:2-oxoglutarate/2-oxoacid ferredoxin oxidoreductase subunit alpha